MDYHIPFQVILSLNFSMNKNISFIMKLLALILIAGAFTLPLLTASISVGWVGDAPDGAMPDFEGNIFEIYVLKTDANNMTYDEVNKEFTLTPVNGSNSFLDSINNLQQIFKGLLLVAVVFTIIPMLVHIKKPSKFMSFLLLLASAAVAIVAGLTLLLQSLALQSLATTGNLNGDTVSIDNDVVVDTITYTWRYSVSLSVEAGVLALIAAAALIFLSIFMKGDYEEYEYYDDDEEYDEY